MVVASLRFLNTDVSFLCYKIGTVIPEYQKPGLYLSIIFSCTKERLGLGTAGAGQVGSRGAHQLMPRAHYLLAE